VTPEPSRRKVGGLLFGISTALLVAAGIVLALLLSRGGGGTEAGPGAGLLPTAPASVAVTATRSTAKRPARAPGAWPVGVTGYTVVIATLAKHGHPRAAAERLARTVQVPGLPARVLDSSQHPRLRPAVWIVYVGRYSTPAPAQRAARQLRAAGIRRGVVERLTG
jgi:SPOR domain